jgi:2-amino-4-hydroxy-6-hydroxymethyldihydropteridine diphosphokinase
MAGQTPPREATVYLSLGSNLGNRRENLKQALRRLQATPGFTMGKVSRIYRAAPQGLTEQPEFLNLALEGRTTLPPLELLRAAKEIERALGRTRERRWGPRVIDIDILLYDAISMESRELILPHPLMHERAFVMVPLAEIAPNLELGGGRRAAELAAALSKEQQVGADV